jgi:hypothetical protein
MKDIFYKPGNHEEVITIASLLDLIGYGYQGQTATEYYKDMRIPGSYNFMYLHNGKETNAVFDTSGYPEVVMVGLSELLSLIAEDLRTPPIKVGDYTVEFKEGGVQVGCTFVPTATVNAIHEKLNS